MGSVGMPEKLWLEEFGDLLYDVFGEVAYHVGSSVREKTWRDVDVRVMIPDEKYQAMGLGDPKAPMMNRKWCGLVKAFSVLGREMTGLPIDFQIQQATQANLDYKQVRSALILKRLVVMDTKEQEP